MAENSQKLLKGSLIGAEVEVVRKGRGLRYVGVMLGESENAISIQHPSGSTGRMVIPWRNIEEIRVVSDDHTDHFEEPPAVREPEVLGGTLGE